VSHNGAGDLTTLPALNGGEQRWSYDGNGNQAASYGITGIVTNTYNDLDQLTNVVGLGTNGSYVYRYAGAVVSPGDWGPRTVHGPDRCPCAPWARIAGAGTATLYELSGKDRRRRT
jgi:hypothetical protein